jgi:hypothetical protein
MKLDSYDGYTLSEVQKGSFHFDMSIKNSIFAKKLQLCQSLPNTESLRK